MEIVLDIPYISHVQLLDPRDYTVHGILQAGILEWVAFPFSRGPPQPRDRTQVSCIAGGFFTSWWEGLRHPLRRVGPRQKKEHPQRTAREEPVRAALLGAPGRGTALGSGGGEASDPTMFLTHPLLGWDSGSRGRRPCLRVPCREPGLLWKPEGTDISLHRVLQRFPEQALHLLEQTSPHPQRRTSWALEVHKTGTFRGPSHTEKWLKCLACRWVKHQIGTISTT